VRHPALRALLLVSAVALVAPTASQARAVPSVHLDAPEQVGQGETFTVEVLLSNGGDEDGSVYFVDIDWPAGGADGNPATDDGIELLSAGFDDSISRGNGFAFDALGRVVHPLLVRNGEPVIVKGRPGDGLWVVYDQLNQLALAGTTHRLVAELRIGKAAAPGKPLTIRVRGGFLRSSLGPSGRPVVSRFATVRVTPTAVTLEEVAGNLRADAVFAAASADPGLPDGNELSVETAVKAARTPVAIAVLPETAGAPESVLDQLRRLSGLGGTIVVLVGREYRAASDRVEQAELDRLLQESGAGADEEPGTVLGDFVRALDRFVNAPETPTVPVVTVPELPDVAVPAFDVGGGVRLVTWLVPVLVVGCVLALVVGRPIVRSVSRNRRERRLARERYERARHEAEAGLAALTSEIADLASVADGTGTDPAVDERYESAVAAYDEAETLLPRATTLDDLATVIGALERGRTAVAAVRARLSEAQGRD
jgi:hypothetical protein